MKMQNTWTNHWIIKQKEGLLFFRKEKKGGLTLLNFKSKHKDRVIKKVWYWTKDK